MSVTTMESLRDRARALIPQVVAASQKSTLDEYEMRAFQFLEQRLRDIWAEADAGYLVQDTRREGEMARVVVETNPQVLAPTLGGEILEVEKDYYALR
jgi:hypothetical protein